ncbi:MAG: winged helix-turn-helix domain-containing protein [Erysipelotrichaceae bacterium]|nr:winged helix-turn-helix domain-containing protein [Erysipelotrichaceae bacterium]
MTNRVTENNRHVTVDVTLVNDLNETEKDIYSLIKDNPKITRDEMALKINKTIRTIQRITNSLVSKGYILRIGNNRFGYWEVLK